MDRRYFLALGLCVAVFIVMQVVFPPPRPRPRIPGAHGVDSAAAESIARARGASERAAAGPGSGATAPAVGAPTSTGPAGSAASRAAAAEARVQATAAIAPPVAETLTVTTPHTIVAFSNVGAAPLAVTMRDYRATTPAGTSAGTAAVAHALPPVVLGRPGETLLGYRIITPHDTIALDHVAFRGQLGRGSDGAPLVRYEAEVPSSAGAPSHVVITYAFGADGYLAHVTGSVTGPGAAVAGAVSAAAGQAPPGYLVVRLPTGFPSFEADSAGDVGELAFVTKRDGEDPSGTNFSRLKEHEVVSRPGPIQWAAAKNKYFVVGVLAPDTARNRQFAEVDMVGGAPTPPQQLSPTVPGEHAATTHDTATAVLPLTPAASGAGTQFALQLYAGPQEFRRLRAIGYGFENLNPYAGFFHVILQPFVTLVVLTILWLKQVLPISYGWILVIFGVVTRVVLWPLNQRAMRTQLKMQRLQPELQDVQSRYKSDQARLQQEMMRVYREHGMSPWSPIAGCLPMLLPWPIFAALYFVFRSTIEFRGVPFLWLHDLSLRDPYYILPVLLGITSFLVSWIGMRNVPPNPQTKMMSYVFPAFMMVFFWRIAAGLNLYYFVQNVATIPQQWYLSNERAKATGVGGGSGGGAGADGKGKLAATRARPGGKGATVAAASTAQGSGRRP